MKPGALSPPTVTVGLSWPLKAAIVARAEAEGISQADLVRRAIATYVARKTETTA